MILRPIKYLLIAWILPCRSNEKYILWLREQSNTTNLYFTKSYFTNILLVLILLIKSYLTNLYWKVYVSELHWICTAVCITSPSLIYKPLRSGCSQAAVRLRFELNVTLLTYKPLQLLCGFKIIYNTLLAVRLLSNRSSMFTPWHHKHHKYMYIWPTANIM